MTEITSKIIEKLILYFDGDARRINHALKVFGFAGAIGQLEGMKEEELQTLEAAAVLHDIGIKQSETKYGSAAARYQEMEGPGVARELLADLGLGNSIMERICHLIGNHHTYGKIDGLDFQILVEADFLVNIFEDAIDKEQVNSIVQKYFKTPAGIRFAASMYKG